LKNLVKV